MNQKEIKMKLQERQNNYIIIKKLIKIINKHSKIDTEKQALYSLDNLLIITFFSIILTVILTYTAYIPKWLHPYLIIILFFVFYFTFRGIAENNIKYRIYAWMISFWYDLPIFFTLINLFFPYEQTFTNYTTYGIEITKIYKYYNIIIYISIILIIGYFNSIFMNYIIRLYTERTPTLSKRIIDRMTSTEGYQAFFGFIVFFQTNFNFKQGILLSNLNISFQDFQTT